MTAYFLDRAFLPGGIRERVRIEIEAGRFVRVDADGEPGGAERVGGLTVPGFANNHSHAFHRALRGRTQGGRGSFWTWREKMYAVAGRLDPELYFALARAVYREMAAAGYTSVAEFHYLHHAPGGTRYADPNAMGVALMAAAAAAGIRITLLDTCYLSAGFGAPPEGAQLRYSDGDAGSWAERVEALDALAGKQALIGAAIHSVRAVPAEQLPTVVAAARGRPLHVHLSEQQAENRACEVAYGVSPARLLDDYGALGPLTTTVHATHLSPDDTARLGTASVWACFCPTTERDLGDGIGPSRALHAAGARLSLGSDGQSVVDPFEEMRAIEYDERLATEQRGRWSVDELLAVGTAHAGMGFPDAGAIRVGMRADLVTLDTMSPRTAGTGAGAATAVFAVGACDVLRTVIDGRVVFTRGQEREIAEELDASVNAVIGSVTP